MTDLPPVPYPTGSWRATRRPLRAVSQSPTRRLGDDLLARISPRTAADLLRYPTGPIKTCLDAAAVSEQAFALRAAVASKKIQDWLDEISEWNWPTAGGSAGFEMPRAKRRKLSFTHHSPVSITVTSGPDSDLNSDAHDGANDNTTYIGSLPAHQVAAYERRVDEIDLEMKDLDLDEIKRHVLHNHIMPLSRPGTPFADTRSNASAMAFVRMDDLTAVITAIVIQALPNLSRLSRLMDTWSTRLSVLHRLPVFLGALEGAEVALQSAYNAIGIATADSKGSDTLSREDFAIMKNVLLPRVTKAARELDCMLDSLEGMEDTLPDEWLDRMEAVEKGSGEWIAACERKIRDAEWAKILEVTRNTFKPPRSTSSATTIAVSERENSSPKSISRPKSAAASDVPGIEVSVTSPTQSIEHFVEDSFTSDILNFDGELSSLMEEEDEDQLPPLGSRRGSMASQQSPTTRRNLGPFSSNRFARELSPELPRLRDAEETFTSDALSPPNSPPVKKSKRSASVTFKEVATVAPAPEYDETPPRTPLEPDFIEEMPLVASPRKAPEENPDDQLQQQISEILESIPAKITLAPEPASAATLNPPDLPIQRMKQRKGVDNTTSSSGRTTSSLSSRAGTPSFTLSPAYARNPRPSRQRSKQDIKLYHLSRSTGEAPIKLFIRCVGERGERVMVRVGGGWADLGEYLKEYAAHHRRQGTSDRANVEVRGINASSLAGHTPTPSSPPSRPSSRPTSALGPSSPMTPLVIRKTRRSVGALDALPRTPLAQNTGEGNTPPSSGAESSRSRSSSRLSWNEEDSSLGLAGPTGKQVEMSEESKAWIESVKKKVRIASGGHQLGASVPSGSLSPDPTLQDGRRSGQDSRDTRRSTAHPPRSKSAMDGRFGEMGKVGSTKRLFRKN